MYHVVAHLAIHCTA